jgi:NitT/TauT family transport system permease protein
LRGFLAFLISLLLGYILAYISYKSEIFKELISPLISFLRSIPTISVIIIVIMIVDLKLISYTIVSLIIFPMIYQNLLHSFENIDNELIMINKMDNINPIKNFFLFIFPITLSGLLNAIIQTLGLSIKIQIMSEILTGSTKIKGIGLLINNYRTNLEIENVFALTLMIILFVYIIELLVKKIKNLINY